MNRAKPWAHRSVLFLAAAFVGGIHPGCVTAEEPDTPEQSQDAGGAQKHTNALINSKSPYLLQHAHNPVHWLPWSDAAFAKAKQEGKPIFLSIGYSTCHWCHVMEKECFEDAQVAALLNRDFIAVKVDREERPDVDDVYMSVASALGSGNGWPLTIVMTPEGKPYFAGTYIPKHDRYGITGLMTRLPVLARQYRYGSSRMDEAMERVDRRLELFARRVPVSEVTIDQAALDHVFGGLMASYDSTYGGFGGSMKFPRPHQLLYLLQYHGRTGSEPAIAAVGHTLDRIRAGGIYDQVGFGVHRYATDRAWFVPHFEKMLYDQAQVAMAAAECYAATGRPKYRRMTEEIFTYVRRDMTSPEGAFYSAEDADSQGEEGKFYVWTAAELQAILSAKQYGAVSTVLGVEAEGNWFDHAARERQPTNILHVTVEGEKTLADASPEFKKDFEAARAILLEHRARRVRPSLDDKVMADSNGLMIAAFARGGRLLDEPAHVAAAAGAFDFVWKNCRDDDRRLVHYWRGGPSPTPAYLDDYAFLAWGAVELYHATFDPKYLIAAGELVEKMNGSFWDEEEGGYFFTAHDAERLLTRPKKFSDMAVPSGNSVATLVLTELAQLTGDVSLEDRAAHLEQLLARGALGMPSRYTQFAVALETRHATAYEAVVVGDPQAEDTRRMLALLREPRPGIHVAVLLKDVTRADNRLAEAAPFTREYRQQDGKATVYVCKQQTCRQPTTDLEVMAGYLK